MVKEIFEFEVVLDFRRNQPTYTVYAVGQWDYHLMDWMGGNYRRIKIRPQPVFHHYADAEAFINDIKRQVKESVKHAVSKIEVDGRSIGTAYRGRFTVYGEGQHISEVSDREELWNMKVVGGEVSQEEFEELKQDYKYKKKELKGNA